MNNFQLRKDDFFNILNGIWEEREVLKKENKILKKEVISLQSREDIRKHFLIWKLYLKNERRHRQNTLRNKMAMREKAALFIQTIVRQRQIKSNRLKICPSKASPYLNESRLFLRNNHRTNNRSASKDELLYSCEEYLLSLPPTIIKCWTEKLVLGNPVIKMKLINHVEDDKWLDRCLTSDESKEGKRIILLMKEIKEGRSPMRLWYKVVIEDLNYKNSNSRLTTRNGQFTLRSFTTGPIHLDYKLLKPSHDENYRIDHSTISVGA